MKEDFHIDMSNRIFWRKNIGIACVGANSRRHNGCALKGHLINLIESKLCVGKIKEEHAKLYAICIYFLIKDKVNEIETLIVCNDEDFNYVKEYLLILLGVDSSRFKIANITDFRKKLGKRVSSLADNFARCYRKRALKPNRWNNGKNLNVVEVDFSMIQTEWKKLSIK